jgi:hypothetical protein
MHVQHTLPQKVLSDSPYTNKDEKMFQKKQAGFKHTC